MPFNALWVAIYGLAYKETYRWVRVVAQTLLAPILSAILYFLIFGAVIGARVGALQQVPYAQYIAPGLIMLSVIINSYSNVGHSFFISRFDRSIESYLISAMPNWSIVVGYTIGGTLRGLTLGLVINSIAFFMTGIMVQHVLLFFVTLLGCSVLFSLAGFINGLVARDFDDTMFFINFILTPLIYLGGVFYNIHDLPGVWRIVSVFNPIYYIINLFRYAMLNIGEQQALLSLLVIYGLSVGLFLIALSLLNRGGTLKH